MPRRGAPEIFSLEYIGPGVCYILPMSEPANIHANPPVKRGRGRPPGAKNRPKIAPPRPTGIIPEIPQAQLLLDEGADKAEILDMVRKRIKEYAEDILGLPLPTLEQALERYRFDLGEKERQEVIEKCLRVLSVSTRSRAPIILALSAHGFLPTEIGMLLGLPLRLIEFDIYTIRRVGYLDNPKARMDQQVIPAAVETVHRAITEGGNIDAAVEALKGRGVFKNHQSVKGDQRPAQMVLGVRIMMPDGREMQQAIEGSVVRPVDQLPEMREGSIHGAPIERVS